MASSRLTERQLHQVEFLELPVTADIAETLFARYRSILPQIDVFNIHSPRLRLLAASLSNIFKASVKQATLYGVDHQTEAGSMRGLPLV
jgi:hypothetical protein